MTKAIAVALALLCMSPQSAIADTNQFCAGFKRGYILAYKRASGSSFEPFTPFCPFQPLKSFSDPESDYEHGIVVGMEQGMIEGQQNQ